SAYNVPTQVNYVGNIYQCKLNISAPFTGSNPTPDLDGTHWFFVGSAVPMVGQNWLNSGSAPGRTATFTSLLTVAANPIVSSGFGTPALGDQMQNLIDTLAGGATGIFRTNLWGTPFNSGFIYLTSMNVKCISKGTGTLTWEIINDAGYVPA